MKKLVAAMALSSFAILNCMPLDSEDGIDEPTVDETAQALGEGQDDSDASLASEVGRQEFAGGVLMNIACEEGAQWVDADGDGQLDQGECTADDETPGLDSDETSLSDSATFNTTSAWILNMHKKIAAAKSATDLQALASATSHTYQVFKQSPDYVAAIKAGTAKGFGVIGPSAGAKIQRLRVMIVMNDMMQMAIRARAKDLGVSVNF